MNSSGCQLCPRACGVHRELGERGFCAAPAEAAVIRAARHDWEEPCISGSRGSGAVFFSGCNLGCVFCQNIEISREIRGKTLNASALRELFLRLRDSGVHNINLVTPTPYADVIYDALKTPIGIPIVWNSSGYELPELVRRFADRVDIWLPDFKYGESAAAAALSSAPNYMEYADASIREMFRQTGPYVLDADGIMQRGVIVRHLVLPGYLSSSKNVLEWFSKCFRRGDAMLSLMSQYTPNGFGGPSRRLTEAEYSEVVDYLYMLGIRDGFVQELSSAAGEFVPAFDGTGVT